MKEMEKLFSFVILYIVTDILYTIKIILERNLIVRSRIYRISNKIIAFALFMEKPETTLLIIVIIFYYLLVAITYKLKARNKRHLNQ